MPRIPSKNLFRETNELKWKPKRGIHPLRGGRRGGGYGISGMLIYLMNFVPENGPPAGRVLKDALGDLSFLW